MSLEIFSDYLREYNAEVIRRWDELPFMEEFRKADEARRLEDRVYLEEPRPRAVAAPRTRASSSAGAGAARQRCCARST